MMAVLKPSEEAKEVAKDLKIELGAMALKTKGLSGFLFELKKKTKGNADLMAKLVPNVRALTAVMALAGKASVGYAYDQEFLAEAMGFTDEAFTKQMESVDFWIETFEVAADKIKIAIYEGLTAQLRESISSAEDFDEKVTQATNNAANAVSLHVSMMVENLQWLGRTLKKTEKFFPIPGLIWRLIKGKDVTEELAEAMKKLNAALDAAGLGISEEEVALENLYARWLKGEDVFDQIIEAERKLRGESKETADTVDDLGDKYGRLPHEIARSAKKIASVVKKMADEIYEATHNEYEVRIRMARKTYEERKAILEKEKADKEAFVLLEKAYAIELDEIDKDRTQKLIEGGEERGKAVTAGLLAWYEAEKATREKIQTLHAGFTDIVRQFTMDETAYKFLKLDEWYVATLEKLGTNLEAKLELIRVYELKKKEIDEEAADSEMSMVEKIGTAAVIALGQSKLGAIAQAIMSTYAGAAKTIEMMGMPFAIPFVAMAILTGLKQVKEIKAVSIPSAEEGGWIPKPALIEAGHGERGEVILPLDKAPMGGLQKIIIQNRITIGEQTFYKESVKSVNLAGEKGDLIVPIKVVVQ